ncbi:MAG: sterol desaturase family protein [Pseudomonadota bacterium]
MPYDTVAEVIEYLAQPFMITPASRLHPVYWGVFLGCGVLAFLMASRRNEAGEASSRSLLAFIFPRKYYLHRSSLTDLKLYIAGYFVRFPVPGLKAFNTSLVAAAVAGLAQPLFPDASDQPLSLAALLLLTVLVAMANDLVTYCTHRLSHEWRVLWPFHEVHHSAEVMTPITVSRKHPVFSLVHNLLHPFIAGPLIGLLAAGFGQTGFVQILGINLVYALFNFAGANLRHSHIWISYGPILSRVFVSPAMHQIHHSIDPKHHNKNYGEIFAIWDWAFGSIYVPRGREELTFGILDQDHRHRVQPHGSLREAYVRPFLDSYDAITERPVKPATIVDAYEQPKPLESEAGGQGAVEGWRNDATDDAPRTAPIS